MSDSRTEDRVKWIASIITHGTNRDNQPLYHDSHASIVLWNPKVQEIARKNEYETAALVKFDCLLGMRWLGSLSKPSEWEKKKGIAEHIAKEIELEDSLTLAALEYIDKSPRIRRKVKYFDLMDYLPIPFREKGRKKIAGFDQTYIYHHDPYGSKKSGGWVYIPEQKMENFRSKWHYYEDNLQRRILEMREEVCGQNEK